MAIGVWGGVAGLGGAIAPTLGAILVEAGGWRAVFFINLPFIVGALIGGWRVLPRDGERKRERFDPVAVPLAAIAVGAIVLVIVEVSDWGLGDPASARVPRRGRRAAAVVLHPLVAPSRRRCSTSTCSGCAASRSATSPRPCSSGSSFGWLVLMPSFFQDVWGWSPLAAGFGLAPAACVGAILSPFAGRLADRIGHRELVAVGCICGAGGTLWWVARGQRATRTTPTAILPGMLLAGLGITGGFATLDRRADEPRPPRFYSMAGAARSTLFQLASAIGIAVAVALQDAVGTWTRSARTRRCGWSPRCARWSAAVVMLVAFPRRDRAATT